jgi:adenylate kinase
MVMNWIEEPQHSDGFVIDGFPRTLAQAEALDEKLSNTGGVDRVVFFDVPEDDKPDVVRNRLHVYIRETEPVIDYFEKSGNLRRIDASLGISEVRESLKEVLR